MVRTGTGGTTSRRAESWDTQGEVTIHRMRHTGEDTVRTTEEFARRSWFRRLQLGLSVLVLAASGVANAQYFFRFDVLPSTTVGCNADSFDVGTSTTSWNLPPAPNNAVFPAIINGVRSPDYPDIQTITPSSGSDTSAGSINPLGSPSVPYTVVVQGFPAINGNPIGTGFQITVQCNTLGPTAGVASYSVVQAPSAAGIPATSAQGLIAIALLLAGAAMWSLHGRRV
jgi:hypothetical protein